MYEKYTNRIPKSIKVKEVCIKICQDFHLGNFIKYEIVVTGYQDFNIILKTSTNNFFVKIFNKYRSRKDCETLTDINLQMNKNGVNCPKIYPYNKNQFLYEYQSGNSVVFLLVQEFIYGINFHIRKSTPNNNEIKTIIKQISNIQAISNINKNYVYDSWYFGNIEKEFAKRKYILQPIEINILQKIIKKFQKIDFDKLPKSFVHGDLTKENVIKDKNGKIWFIDFSVANIYPKILEIAVINTHLIINYSDQAETNSNRNLVINEFEKNQKLSQQEKNYLPSLELTIYAIEYLICIYELRKNNDYSEENLFYIRSSTKGLLTSNILTTRERSFLLSTPLQPTFADSV